MSNIKRFQAALNDAELGAILLTGQINRHYAAGFQSSDGAVLITEREAWFLTDSRYEEAARAAVTDAEVLLVTRENPYSVRINAIIAERGITAVGFEEREVTYSAFLDWEKKLSSVELRPMQSIPDKLRAVKSPDELAAMKKAQRLAEKAFEEILPIIKAGLTERELASELIYRILKKGADGPSFDPIIVSGERSSMPHGVPTDRRIADGFLTIDFGARLDGWCSDTTRTLCIGQPTDEMVRVYDIVLKAQEAGIRFARAGVKGKDVDAAARKIIEKAGFGEYFGHGFGHGLGLEVHEPPNAAPSADTVLPRGAVISAEPGIYLPGRFGVRIEDVVYLTEDGCENITNLEKNLIIL